MFSPKIERAERSPAMAPSTPGTLMRKQPKKTLNRPTVVEVKRQGSKIKRQTVHINFDKKDLHQLISCVERALHKSPSDPPIRLTSLSYLSVEANSGGTSSALDGTPFSPRPKPKKSAGGGKGGKFTLLTPKIFDPKVFLAMDKVFLAAVVAAEGDDDEDGEHADVVNDENNRRLSNGSVSTTTNRPTGRGVGIGDDGTGSDPLVRSPSPPTRHRPPPSRLTSPAEPACEGRRLRAPAKANKRAGGGGNDGHGRESPPPPPPLPSCEPSREPPTELSGISGGDVLTRMVLSVERGGAASSPTVSALSSRSSSLAAAQRNDVVDCGGGGDHGKRGRDIDRGRGGDTVGGGPGHEESANPFVTTYDGGEEASGGDASSPQIPSPGPGMLSMHFRRASVSSQLPPAKGVDGGGDGGDGATSRAEERFDGGVNTDGGSSFGSSPAADHSGGGGGSTNSSHSVGRGAGLGCGGGKRTASRSNAVATQQRPKARSNELGGLRQDGGGSSSSPGCLKSRRAVIGGKVGGQPEKVGKPEGGSGEGVGDKAQGQVIKKRALYPKLATASTVAKFRGPDKRIPMTPSAKRPLANAGTPAAATAVATTPSSRQRQHRQQHTTTNSATVTPRKKQHEQQHEQHRSAWAVTPSKLRQPPFKPVGTPKAKLPLRTNAATATPTKLPKPKGTVSGEGESGGGGGGGGSGVDESDFCTSGGGSPSPSKRPPPRVSASGHMFWERNLRTTTKTPSKDKSTLSKKDVQRRALRKAGKGGGGGGGGWGSGDGGGGNGGDGRPSFGTWTKTQNYLQILKELSGKDDEELQWLAVAKQGNGIKKSEKRQESAETEYHRLLCEESMQQAGLKLLKDRRLEVALQTVAKLGTELDRVTDLLEALGERQVKLVAENEEAERQESAEVEAASAKAEAAADKAAEASLDDDAESCDDEATAGPAAAALVVALAAAEAAEAAVAAASATSASRRAEMERLEQAKREAEENLGKVLADIGAGKDKLGVLGAVLKEECLKVPGRGGSALETAVGITADVCSARDLIAPNRAKSGLRSLEIGAETLAETLNKTRSDSQAALGRMEKWRERKEALPEYERVVADKEKAWFERERVANEQALRRTRSLLPVGVAGLTLAQLEQRAVDAGSLYPRELSLRLKENRLLHWAVTHPDDIARSNFLRGDHAHYFTNLDQYDLVELRAVLACLPAKFEVDGDGRKAAWRAAFLQRVQGLVAQERGDTVSGGWDPELQARREVRLPKLTSEQARRKEYFYPTAAEVENKLGKLRERQQRLEAKEAKLAQVKDELLPEAKEEYANVLEDTRHPANKEAFKPEDLRRARDEAKMEVDRLSKELRRLEGDVASAQRALRESPYTVESLQAEADATRRLLAERSRKARDLAKQQKEKEAADNVAAAASTIGTLGAAQAASAAGDPDVVAGLDDAAEASEDLGAAPAQNQDNEDEEAEEVEVEEGLEVEGGFEADPELKSRFADKSSSLRFVTAEEDARMRKEELVSVFAVRNKAVSAENEEGVKGRSVLPAVEEISGEGKSCSKGQEDHRRVDGGPVDGDSVPAGAGPEDAGLIGRGDAKGRMKAFGAMLEKTLSQSLLGRAPPSGSVPVAAASAGVGAGAVAGGMVRVLMSPPRQQQSETKPAAILTPPCKPKSKFFRSIQSPAATAQSDDNSGGTIGETGRSLVPPPPAPMMGLLSQIRARAQGAVGNGGDGCGTGTKLGEGGLLAQIRTTEGAGACGGSDPNDKEGASPANVEGRSRGIAPASPPRAPALPVPSRSLFAAAGSCAAFAAVQGPPPDFFAQLRAKAEEKRVLRLAEEAKTER